MENRLQDVYPVNHSSSLIYTTVSLVQTAVYCDTDDLTENISNTYAGVISI